ncbi:MAG: SxtJ family membrane protein [Candidatus Eisenbacteria bacterium]
MAKSQSWLSVIAEEVRAVKDDPRSLRRFGLTMGIALGAFGGLFFWRDKAAAPYLFILAAVFLLLAALAPRALRPIQKVWMALATVLGWVMTRVLLVIVYYIGVTPIALIARLFGKRFLSLGFDPDAATYWEKRKPDARGKERYESQF